MDFTPDYSALGNYKNMEGISNEDSGVSIVLIESRLKSEEKSQRKFGRK